jgi:hypothetical protein
MSISSAELPLVVCRFGADNKPCSPQQWFRGSTGMQPEIPSNILYWIIKKEAARNNTEQPLKVYV